MRHSKLKIKTSDYMRLTTGNPTRVCFGQRSSDYLLT